MGRGTPRAVMAVAALALIIPGAAAMHLRLVKSAPAEREIAATPPSEVRLWFSQKPEVSLTTIGLMRQDSTMIPLGKVSLTNDSVSVRAAVNSALVPGAYLVTWRTMSKDGHVVRGKYEFVVAPCPPARKQTGGN